MKLTKKHAFPKAFFALTLALTMCLGGLTTVFAAGDPVEGNEATIKKVLQMPEGTSTPAATFTFHFEKKSYNDNAADKAKLPTITDKNISFLTSENGSTSNGLKIVSKESADFFSGISFPNAGVYTYTLTETSGTYGGTELHHMDYSGAEYEIRAYVENGAGGPELKKISAVIVKKDGSHDGTVNVGDKVNPTPGQSTLVFTNSYTKTPGGGSPSDGALAISKTVAGSMGDQTKYFPFTVKTKAAGTQSGTVTYKAYLMENSSVITPAAENGTFTTGTDGSGTYIKVTAGTDLSINLKHGQSLVFTDLPVGASFEAEEDAVPNYAPSVVLTVNDNSVTVPGGTVGTSLSTSEQMIGEKENSAAFTNTFDTSITPTGISMNDLPFIMMIALAAGALVLFVVVKSRKKADAFRR